MWLSASLSAYYSLDFLRLPGLADDEHSLPKTFKGIFLMPSIHTSATCIGKKLGCNRNSAVVS